MFVNRRDKGACSLAVKYRQGCDAVTSVRTVAAPVR